MPSTGSVKEHVQVISETNLPMTDKIASFLEVIHEAFEGQLSGPIYLPSFDTRLQEDYACVREGWMDVRSTWVKDKKPNILGESSLVDDRTLVSTTFHMERPCVTFNTYGSPLTEWEAHADLELCYSTGTFEVYFDMPRLTAGSDVNEECVVNIRDINIIDLDEPQARLLHMVDNGSRLRDMVLDLFEDRSRAMKMMMTEGMYRSLNLQSAGATFCRSKEFGRWILQSSLHSYVSYPDMFSKYCSLHDLPNDI